MLTTQTVTKRHMRITHAWVTLGTASVAFQTWLWIRWASTGGPLLYAQEVSVSPGRSVAMLLLACGFAITAITVIAKVIADCRHEGQFTAEATLLAGYMSAFWVDGVCNYRHPTMIYTGYLLNVKGWAGLLPGATIPNAEHVTVSLLGEVPVYPASMAFVLLLAALAQRMDHRYGQRTAAAVTVSAAVAVMFVCNACAIFSGVAAYRNTPWAIWADHWYQFPILETFAMALLWLLPAALVLGLGRIDLLHGHDPEGSSLSVRLLAGIGFVNFFCLLYCVFNAALSDLSGQVPVIPSHFMAG